METAESLGFEHQGSRGPAYGEAFRDNHRTAVNDAVLAEQLWRSTGLALALRELKLDGAVAVGLNPNLRFYRWESLGLSHWLASWHGRLRMAAWRTGLLFGIVTLLQRQRRRLAAGTPPGRSLAST